jgi:phosphomevalonate kinase
MILFMPEREPIVSQTQDNFKPYGVFFTGKRFTGKDTAARLLHDDLIQNGILSVIKSTALNLKVRFCEANDLNLDKFLFDRDYKERYRKKLSEFVSCQSTEKNIQDFIESIKIDLATIQVLIVSDLRNNVDQEQLSRIFPVLLTIKISASDETRLSRGYTPSAYDDSVFETQIEQIVCDLDIPNNGTIFELSKKLEPISEKIQNYLSR